MKIMRHIAIIATLSITIYVVCWIICGQMILHIFSHRDIGYTSQETVVAKQFDQAALFCILPTVILLTFANFISPRLATSLSIGCPPFVFDAIVWALLLYGLGLTFLLTFRHFRKKMA